MKRSLAQKQEKRAEDLDKRDADVVSRILEKEQAREMEAFGLEQVKGTPLVHSFERTKDRHPQVNFMDLNGFSRWFRNFSVENGFGKFEGVRT